MRTPPTALVLAAALNPVLWHLWVERYTGNANFVLATTIVHALALTTGVVDVAASACRREGSGEEEGVEGKKPGA